MIVASDERRHAWMDEGFASFLNAISGPVFYDANPDTTIAGYGEGAQVRMYRLTRSPYVAGRMQEPMMQDQPIITPADQLRRPALGFLAYRKPAKGLFILRDFILGPERFDEALMAYVERWAYKHPQPADFFRTMEDVSGEDLDWFWRGWFMTTETLDQAIAGVEPAEDGAVVTVENRSGLVMPAELAITYADGTTERVRVPVEAFYKTDTFRVAADGAVTSVRLDPDDLLPDVDETNDVWTGDAVGTQTN
jgi:aminopeptidase N